MENNISDEQLKKLSSKDLYYLSSDKLDKISMEGLNILASPSSQGISAQGIPTDTGMPDILPKVSQPTTLKEKAIGAGEAALSAISGATTGTLGGMMNMLTTPSANVSAQREAEFKRLNPNVPYNALEQKFIKGAEQFTYAPRTQTGQEYAGNVADVIQQSGLQGLAGMPIAGKVVPKPSIPSAQKSGVTSSVLGMTTGTGAEALSQAYKAGKEGGTRADVFRENLRGEVPVELVLKDAKSALEQMKANKSAEYVANRQGWAADTTKLDFAPIEQSFKTLEDSLKQGGKWKIGKDEINKVNEVKSVISSWKKSPTLHTTVGLDALKQRIDAIYPDSPKQNQAQRVISQASKAVKEAIIKQAPDYETAMKDYESMSSTIKDIESALSLGNKASKDTALRKLQSLTRNNVQTNYGGRLDMVKQLEDVGGANIMPSVSGQALSAKMPRGLAGQLGGTFGGLAAYANPMYLATLPFMSPRLMGESAYAAGKASNYMPTLPRIPYNQLPYLGLLNQQPEEQGN